MRSAVFLFPGQGSQYVGMGQGLSETSTLARSVYEEANAVLGFDLAALSFHGPLDTLTETDNAQPAILAHSVAAWRELESRGVGARAAAGHSVGEYAAYVAAGALALSDALRLVRRRGELMREAGRRRPGSMAAILGLDLMAVEAACRAARTGIVVPANINAPNQIVISGDPQAVAEAGENAREAGAKRVVPLKVAGAFHSPLMEYASQGLRSALAEVPMHEARVPVIANTTARPVTDPDAIRESLALQLTSPVRWVECEEALLADPGPPFVEAGPGKVLTGLLRSLDREAVCQAVGEPADLTEGIPA